MVLKEGASVRPQTELEWVGVRSVQGAFPTSLYDYDKQYTQFLNIVKLHIMLHIKKLNVHLKTHKLILICSCDDIILTVGQQTETNFVKSSLTTTA